MLASYILLIFMWGAGDHSSNPVTAVEFQSQDRCEAAGQVAKAKFSGWGSTLYYVCVQK